ncbi:MAG: NUDIX domain-containing protein [Acidimicrobiales bacterium]|jgi:ADP-ribose pyrophosphatase YjhB (NUDIX family)
MARGPLPQAEYEAVYAKVPRLTVEVLITSSDGVLLSKRQSGPCKGLWHLPGGTVRFGEHLTDAVRRVAQQELGLDVCAKDVLGYIEYPSHLELGIDWPVGIVFGAEPTTASLKSWWVSVDEIGWFRVLPGNMHDEQILFLRSRALGS